MQFAKDSFYIALRDRLATLNPQRTVFLNGVTRPAVVVAENEHITAAGQVPEAFYIRWGDVRPGAMRGGPHPLLALECTISYGTAGSADKQGVDRGRVLAELDCELLSMCSPPYTPKCDHMQTPAADLGTKVLWSTPELRLTTRLQASEQREWSLAGDQLLTLPPGTAAGNRLEREAGLTIFFYAEAV